MLSMSLPRISAVKDSYFATEEAKEVANAIRAARIDAINNRTTVGLVVISDLRNVLEIRRLPIQSWDKWNIPGLASNQDMGAMGDASLIQRTKVSGHLVIVAPDQEILFFANGSSTGGGIATHDEEGNLLHSFSILASTGELLVQ